MFTFHEIQLTEAIAYAVPDQRRRSSRPGRRARRYRAGDHRLMTLTQQQLELAPAPQLRRAPSYRAGYGATTSADFPYDDALEAAGREAMESRRS